MAKLIVLEGGEGAGKSTQAARLAQDLGAVLTREPGGTKIGEALRVMLLDPAVQPLHPRAELLLMLAARAQHVAEVIEPALSSGRDVVCDRYSGSTFAYQGYGRDLPLGELARLDNWATNDRQPDVVVLLDVPGEVSRHRRAGRRADRFEGEDDQFQARVRAGFRELAAGDPQRWHVVDASGPPDVVAEAVRTAVSAAISHDQGAES